MYKIIFLTLLSLFSYSLMAKPITVLCLGDSLTEGLGVPEDQNFPSRLQKHYDEKGWKVKILNGGISGSTSAGSAKRLQWFLRVKPELLFLALGANDGLRGQKIEIMKKNLTETIQLAKKNGIQVILAGMQIPPNYGEKYTLDFKKAFHEIAQKNQIKLMPFLLADVGGEPQYNQPDGIHPNSDGYAIIYKNVAKYLDPAIQTLIEN